MLAQTYQHFEIIIVDDCSTDNTVVKINEIVDSRIKVFVNLANNGASYSRNIALEACKGDWVAVLDGDDWYDSKRLQRIAEVSNRYECDIICDDLYLIDDVGRKPFTTVLKRKNFKLKDSIFINSVEIAKFGLGVLQPVVKRKFLLDKKIKYDEKLRYGEDWDFLLQCSILGARIFLLETPYYYYRQNPDSLMLLNKIHAQYKLIEFVTFFIKKIKEHNGIFNHNKDVISALEGRVRFYENNILYLKAIKPFRCRKWLKGFKNILSLFIKRPDIISFVVSKVFLFLKYKLIKKYNSLQ